MIKVLGFRNIFPVDKTIKRTSECVSCLTTLEFSLTDLTPNWNIQPDPVLGNNIPLVELMNFTFFCPECGSGLKYTLGNDERSVINYLQREEKRRLYEERKKNTDKGLGISNDK